LLSNAPPPRGSNMARSSSSIATSTQSSSLADILERVLDKGIVIAGDITVSVGSTELLSVRIRLLISSVDKAREMGINWWEGDPYLSAQARQLQDENQQLQQRLERLETELRALRGSSELPATLGGRESAPAAASPLPSQGTADDPQTDVTDREGSA